MTLTDTALLIPHRNSRTFVHGSDIYETCIKHLTPQFPSGSLTALNFYFHQPLGSQVIASMYTTAPRPEVAAAGVEISFAAQGIPYWLCIRNRKAQPELAQTYRFDESQVKEAIAESNGEFRFTKRVHDSNIHLMLAPIKFILPYWPETSSQVQILKLQFILDVQTLAWDEISWRVNPREAFNVTTYFNRGKQIGEATHVFLREAK